MIDKSKTYRTRDGREVRIYATDGGGRNPIHGSVKDEDGWIFQVWPKSGRYFEDDADEDYRIDLIEVPPRHKRVVWLNVYGSGIVPEACSSKERADLAAGHNRIACLRVELDFEEGEGL